MTSNSKGKSQQRLAAYIERLSIASAMNRTKWKKLFEALEPIGQRLIFRRKDLRRDWVNGEKWNYDFFEVFGLEEEIEWIEISIRPLSSKQTCSQINEISATEELEYAISGAGIQYERTTAGVRIWGYLRPGASPEWVREKEVQSDLNN